MLHGRREPLSDRGDPVKRIVATGTFDILHPGHLFYLEESRRLGDELFVIVARDSNVKHKPKPVVCEEQRLAMIRALKPVDHAELGDLHDMFRPIEAIRPDIITLGFNQHFDPEHLRHMLRERKLDTDVVRVGRYNGPLTSSSKIVEQILKTRATSPGHGSEGG
jgi:FAD synthetase